MTFHFRAVLALAMAAAPVTLSGQEPARAGNPAARLLEHRAELSLTAEQVRGLEALDRRTSQQDAELRARLEALRGRALGQPLHMRTLNAEERARVEARRAEMQPLAQQLRTMHAQTAAEARALLTEAQRSQADTYLFRGPGQGLGRGPAAGGPRGAGGRAWRAGRGAGAGAGSYGVRAGGRGWRGGWD